MKIIDRPWTDYRIGKISKEDKNYPENLLTLPKPPEQLFYRGSISGGLFESTVSIVGSRRMTRYGASTVDKFVSSLVSGGATTVSGYMYGVDTEVHTKTVEYGGRTVAVLGGGIDSPYPPENDKLYTKILQNNGAVLSEYSPEIKPKLWMYPQRNRIVAALATLGVLVVEAGVGSGSLITARLAKELGKKVYAVPGQINSPTSQGTNLIIKNGDALMATAPSDIGGVFAREVPAATPVFADKLEEKIYGLLLDEELGIDELCAAAGESVVAVSTAISVMSVKGILLEEGGKYFIREQEGT